MAKNAEMDAKDIGILFRSFADAGFESGGSALRSGAGPGRFDISGNLLHPPGQSAAMSHWMARIRLGRLN